MLGHYGLLTLTSVEAVKWFRADKGNDPVTNPILVETTRGPLIENRHRAAAVICTASGDIVEAWGDGTAHILPRSSIKMIQALPLIESGAAEAARLKPEHLALACASHQGAAIHTDAVAAWLEALSLSPAHLLCGPQPPRDAAVKATDRTPTRLLNNCSGKQTGFLTLARHIGAAVDGYLDPDAPVQSAVADAFADMTGTEPPLAYGIDGCSAPNFAASLSGIAHAMAQFAQPDGLGRARGAAAQDLVAAMAAHPIMVSGEGRACLALTTATKSAAVVKTGADGVFTGIYPKGGVGFCLKVDDGNTAAAESLCAALLVRIGALEASHPIAQRYCQTEITNFNGESVGVRRVSLG